MKGGGQAGSGELASVSAVSILDLCRILTLPLAFDFTIWVPALGLGVAGGGGRGRR